ncbi:MAG: dTMP kinase [Gammaproteobacteria bacterium]|nr:dTMP kinase [Gammaproteobacteria bacterium]
MNNSSQCPRFLTLEGGEGAGKSTNIDFLRRQLVAAGVEVVVTREPGGTTLGEQLRALLLDTGSQLCDDTELLMMFAARAQHLEEVIRPALARGCWVLCDRFTEATYAYQGDGRGINLERIAQLETWVQGELRPDRVLLLDLPVAVGMERIGGRGGPDRFEREAQAFFQRVRDGYLRQAEADPERFRVIDATVSLARVQQQLNAAVADLL